MFEAWVGPVVAETFGLFETFTLGIAAAGASVLVLWFGVRIGFRLLRTLVVRATRSL